MKKISFFLNFIVCTFFALQLTGCASIKEKAKGVAGLSTKILEDGRQDAIKKDFNYDYFACYRKVKNMLKEKGSYIYAEDSKKHMIAIYLSWNDTSAVGIFFKVIDKETTQIEVSSPSPSVKELIANRISNAIEPPPETKETPATGSTEGNPPK